MVGILWFDARCYKDKTMSASGAKNAGKDSLV